MLNCINMYRITVYISGIWKIWKLTTSLNHNWPCIDCFSSMVECAKIHRKINGHVWIQSRSSNNVIITYHTYKILQKNFGLPPKIYLAIIIQDYEKFCHFCYWWIPYDDILPLSSMMYIYFMSFNWIVF